MTEGRKIYRKVVSGKTEEKRARKLAKLEKRELRALAVHLRRKSAEEHAPAIREEVLALVMCETFKRFTDIRNFL